MRSTSSGVCQAENMGGKVLQGEKEREGWDESTNDLPIKSLISGKR